MLTENIPNLKIETNGDGCITLEQDWCGNVDRVAIHPLHVRHLAEQLGLVRTLSESGEEMRRENSRLKRALLMIRDRSTQLHQNIFDLSQLGHEDMGIEVAQSAALADMADMVCAEFEGDFECMPVDSPKPEGQPAPAPDADKLRTPSGQASGQLEIEA